MTSLRVHTRLAHTSKETNPDRPFRCNLCKKDFKFDFSYEAHMNSHEMAEKSQKKKAANEKRTPIYTPVPVRNSPEVIKKIAIPEDMKLIPNVKNVRFDDTPMVEKGGDRKIHYNIHKIPNVKNIRSDGPQAISKGGVKICPPRVQTVATEVKSKSSSTDVQVNNGNAESVTNSTTTAELVTADGESREVVVEIINMPDGEEKIKDEEDDVKDLDDAPDERIEEPETPISDYEEEENEPMPSLQAENKDHDNDVKEEKEDHSSLVPLCTLNLAGIPRLSPEMQGITEQEAEEEDDSVADPMEGNIIEMDQVKAVYKYPGENMHQQNHPVETEQQVNDYEEEVEEDGDDEMEEAEMEDDVEEEEEEEAEELGQEQMQHGELDEDEEEEEEEEEEEQVDDNPSRYIQPKTPPILRQPSPFINTALMGSGGTGFVSAGAGFTSRYNRSSYNPLPVLQPVRSMTQAIYTQGNSISVNRPPPKQKPKKRKDQPFIYDCVMHEETPFDCDICEKSFRWEVSLRIHKRDIHEGGPPKRKINRYKPPNEAQKKPQGVLVSRIVSRRSSSDEEDVYDMGGEVHEPKKRKYTKKNKSADGTEQKPVTGRKKSIPAPSKAKTRKKKKEALPPESDERLKVCHIREAGKGYTLYIAKRRPDEEDENKPGKRTRGRPRKSESPAPISKKPHAKPGGPKKKYLKVVTPGAKRVTRSRSSVSELDKGIPMDRDEIRAANLQKRKMTHIDASESEAVESEVNSVHDEDEDAVEHDTHPDANGLTDTVSETLSVSQYMQDYEQAQEEEEYDEEEDDEAIGEEDEHMEYEHPEQEEGEEEMGESEQETTPQNKTIDNFLPQTMQAHLRWTKILNVRRAAFVCRFCTKVFTKKQSLKMHLLRHTGRKAHSCNFCPEKFPDRISFLMHCVGHRNRDDTMCGLCGHMCTQYSSLQRHVVFHVSCDSYSCSTCGRRFMKSSALNYHMDVHRTPEYQCDTCRKVFTDKNKFDQHQMTGCIFSAFLG